jgi:DNA/RNA-binding domain of Phe-tRNA-synthetase-like protein
MVELNSKRMLLVLEGLQKMTYNDFSSASAYAEVIKAITLLKVVYQELYEDE